MQLYLLMLLACVVVAASTETWQGSADCSAVPLPAQTWGASGAVDLTTTITLDVAGMPAVVLCPGVAYNVVVRFPNKRRFNLAASQGSLALPTPAICANRVVSTTGATTVQQTLILPCNATGYTYITVASVDAALASTTKYKLTMLPYAISPVAACLTSTCPNKDFNFKMLSEALATAQSFPAALQSLQSNFAEGLQNIGGDVVGNVVSNMGLSDELQALTAALHTIGGGLSSGSSAVNPAAFLSAIQQLAFLMGGSGPSTSTGMPGLLNALQVVGTAVAGAPVASPLSAVNLQALLTSMAAVGKLLNPSSANPPTPVTLQTLAISAQKVLTTLVALIPSGTSATGSATSINLPALIGFAQAVGGLFVQMNAFSAAFSG